MLLPAWCTCTSGPSLVLQVDVMMMLVMLHEIEWIGALAGLSIVYLYSVSFVTIRNTFEHAYSAPVSSCAFIADLYLHFGSNFFIHFYVGVCF